MILAGTVLGERYEIRRRLGAGGMGEVFAAHDRDRGVDVAIKTLARADADTLARFKREFRALQSTAHPNLVAIGELACLGDLWFFTMELVDGRHLLEHVRGDLAALRAAFAQLAAGLLALHDAGLVHRDVKPSNVMVTREGRVVILDFGLVTTLDPAGQSLAGGPVGTIDYMAPEQASGRTVTAAADWYAAGAMLYEALTGKPPHTGHALQILVAKQEVEPAPAHTVAADTPRDLSDLAAALLAIEPDARPRGEAVARTLGVAREDARHSTTPVLANVFVGREVERAALAASAEVARRRPRVHLVIGESGIGKSELVRRFARDLATAEPDALVLTARCYERESVPFKAFDGIADGLVEALVALPDGAVRALLPREADLLVRLFPTFQRVDAIAAAPATELAAAEAYEQRRRLFRAFRGLVAALARSRRVVLAIDDLQWADADSFLLLRELVRGADAPPVLVLATVRGDVPALAPALAGLDVERTALGPLTEEECLALARGVAPEAAGRVDVGRLAREAGGHPMFVHELLRFHGVSGGLARGLSADAAATLDDALAARVALLRPEARTLLEIACLAGAPLAVDTAARAARLDPILAARAIASLRVATLVREIKRGRTLAIEPYHDRVRESVGGRVEAGARRELHARIAFALEGGLEARDPQLLLRHFVLGELPERAARYAEEAAQRSEDARAFDQAAELWRVALDVVHRDAEERRRLQLRLARALVGAGRGAEAAEHYLAAAEGADRATRLECQCHAAEQLVISGRIAPGIAALEALLAEIGVAYAATPRRAIASLLWHRAQLRVRGLGFRERHRREIADAELLELETLKVASHSLAMTDAIRGMDFQTRHLRAALRTGNRDAIARAFIIESMYLATASQRARAERYVTRAIALDPEDPYIAAMALGARGAAAYFAGDIVDGEGLLARCIVALRDVPGSNWERSTARLFHVFALRFIGDYVVLRGKYEEYANDAAYRGDAYLDSTMRRAAVPLWLAEDDAAGAVRELEGATWIPPGERYHVQHFHELVGWAEIGLYRGAPEPRAQLDERLGALRASLLLRIESVRVQYDYLRGRLGLAGHLPAREVARAIRALRGADNPVARVWGELLVAGAAARRPDALAAYGRAIERGTRAGMQATVAVARWRIAELRADAALRAGAEAELAALGVRDPARTSALIAPRPI